jgi:hypothetical protein
VVAVPIGVDFDRIRAIAADAGLAAEQDRLRALLGLRADIIGLGVDRLDYTKGIPERLQALDALVTRRPELRGHLTFVQVGVPSRSELESYASMEAEIGVGGGSEPPPHGWRRPARVTRTRSARAWWRCGRRTSASSARCTTA